MFTFNHSGKIGDLLYSLYFCRAFARATGNEKFNFQIQLNVPQTLYGRERDIPRMNMQTAKFVASLLKPQPYINDIFIVDKFTPAQGIINLDDFRTFPLNFSNGYIAEWYYNLVNFPLARKYDEQILDAEPNKELNGKIIFCQTKKYINPFVSVLDVLEKYKDKVVFIGLDSQYEIIKASLDVPRFEVKSGLELAQAIKGASLIVSNQNGSFAVAQLMKTNRILIPAQYELVGTNKEKLENGPANVVCHGGWYEYANTTKKLEELLKILFPSKS